MQPIHLRAIRRFALDAADSHLAAAAAPLLLLLLTQLLHAYRK
jgi:hypothetical protein